MRFLLFTAVIFGIFYFFYHKLRQFLGQLFQPLTQNGTGGEEGRNNNTPERINKGEMLRCPACGVYFPEGTGIKSGGKEYCSKPCAEKTGSV